MGSLARATVAGAPTAYDDLHEIFLAAAMPIEARMLHDCMKWLPFTTKSTRPAYFNWGLFAAQSDE